jgi:hypothetical protein
LTIVFGNAKKTAQKSEGPIMQRCGRIQGLGLALARRVVSPFHQLRFFIAVGCFFLLGTSAFAQVIQNQNISLTTGWNLISFQVGEAITRQQFSASLSTNGLLQIWGCDAATKWWQFYKTNTPSTLPQLEPERGYWVQVSRANSLTLKGAVWNGGKLGWNLVGFPGLTFDPNGDGSEKDLCIKRRCAC